jgi:hypothetical protein
MNFALIAERATVKLRHCQRTGLVSTYSARPHVRYKSKADIAISRPDVRFTPPPKADIRRRIHADVARL